MDTEVHRVIVHTNHTVLISRKPVYLSLISLYTIFGMVYAPIMEKSTAGLIESEMGNLFQKQAIVQSIVQNLHKKCFPAGQHLMELHIS